MFWDCGDLKAQNWFGKSPKKLGNGPAKGLAKAQRSEMVQEALAGKGR